MGSDNGGGEIRVLVAATSAVRRGGLEAIVREGSSLRLVGSAPGLVGLAGRARELQPDVVLIDLPQPDTQFISTVAALEQAGVAVIVLIDQPARTWTARMLQAGVHALMPRESTAGEIHSAIQAASGGMVVLDPHVARGLASRSPVDLDEGASDTVEELTPREVEVLRMMAEGLGNKQIALRLGISDHTVKFHISSILAKVGASTRTEAVTTGIRMGLILL